MHQPADVLHFGTPRTPLLRNNPPHEGVRHQPHDSRPGPRRRLVRGAVGARLRQIPRNGAHAWEGLAGRGADRRRGACKHRVPRAAGDAPRFARYVSGRGGRRAGRCRLYRPCYGAFLPRTRLPDRLLPRRIFRPGRGHRPLRLVGAQEAAPDGGRCPRSPCTCRREYPGCGSFRSTRGRPRGREARRKTCPCAKTRSTCRPPFPPQPDAKKPRR